MIKCSTGIGRNLAQPYLERITYIDVSSIQDGSEPEIGALKDVNVVAGSKLLSVYIECSSSTYTAKAVEIAVQLSRI